MPCTTEPIQVSITGQPWQASIGTLLLHYCLTQRFTYKNYRIQLQISRAKRRPHCLPACKQTGPTLQDARQSLTNKLTNKQMIRQADEAQCVGAVVSMSSAGVQILTVLSAAKVSSCCCMSSLMGSAMAEGRLLPCPSFSLPSEWPPGNQPLLHSTGREMTDHPGHACLATVLCV